MKGLQVCVKVMTVSDADGGVKIMKTYTRKGN